MATLFDTLQLGPLTLNNRVALAPLTRSRGTQDHVANALSARYYAERASGGLLISEGCPVSQAGVGYICVPGLWNDAQVEAWRPIVQAVHEEGGRIFAQIWHVGRMSHTAFQPNGQAPVSASAIAANAKAHTHEGRFPTSVPTALTTDGIAQVVADFANAARNAAAAGFDGVEIHGANGYLLEQFLYSGVNLRTDAYGGSVANRARLMLEVVDAVVAELGAGRVGLRISPQNTFGDAHDDNRRETYAHLVAQLKGRGLVYLHLREALSTPDDVRLLPMIREGFDGVILINEGYDRASADAVIERGEADMVAFGVSYLANPDLPARLRLNAPLNPPNPALFYSQGAAGYNDYPFLEAGYSVLVALEVIDPVGYASYRSAIKALLASYGGRFTVDMDVERVRLPVGLGATRVFVGAFPSQEAATAFFTDPRYLAIKGEHFPTSVREFTVLGSFVPAE